MDIPSRPYTDHRYASYTGSAAACGSCASLTRNAHDFHSSNSIFPRRFYTFFLFPARLQPMIVLTTDDPSGLWHKICTAVRERRFECWELLSNNQLALFEWPTRHTKLHFSANINPPQRRLILFEQAGHLPCNTPNLVQYQEEFSAKLQQRFPHDIELLRIADASVARLDKLMHPSQP